MSKNAARIALVASIVGLSASVAAAWVHYHILADPAYTSFCDVNATVNCSNLYSSQYGTFSGVPVAIFGAIWFAWAALLSIAATSARQGVSESVPGYLFAGSTIALAAVLYLGYASLFLMKQVCPLCVITYAAVITLFLISGAVTSVPMASLPRRAAYDLKVLFSTPIALILALVWIGGSATTLAFFPRPVTLAEAAATAAAAPAAAPASAAQGRSELERFMATQPRVPLVVASEGAKVLIVKFNDFQCPACSQSYLAYKPILAKYAASNPGAVKLVLKDYPLSMRCNPTMQTELHSAACEAAVAVRLAREHNRGDQMEEWLYTHQSEMTPVKVKEMAREVGLVTDFDARYEATIALVKGDISLGQSLKVSSTPTFYINGVKIEGAWQPQFFDQAIAYELQHAQ
ncbi:MAG: thioredoxin domain-containing protein [Acidobacteriaceae bacterium]|jgi:uncharacterized membrane protein/protein-disulfide isomerase|nr:thioredoxin domain-containing protein [Acidobacteriaceae bacterium]